MIQKGAEEAAEGSRNPKEPGLVSLCLTGSAKPELFVECGSQAPTFAFGTNRRAEERHPGCRTPDS